MIETFYVVGIAVRTTNENERSGQDIPQLWNQFFTEGIADKIPGKVDDTMYCVYTDYEKDHTQPYTTVLGYKVENLDTVPHGLTGIKIEKGNYKKFIAKGDPFTGAVLNEWKKIWNSGIERSYSADFEVYDEKARRAENSEVDIFIAIG